jgi:hypothetical protein
VSTLFDLDRAGEIIPRLPCGHDVRGTDGDAHERDCLGGVCPCCRERDPTGYSIWLHHNPRGYADDGVDYCAVQRHMFEVVSECRVCRFYNFGTSCRNTLCKASRRVAA